MSIHHHNTLDNFVKTSEAEIQHGRVDAFARQIAQLPESERQDIATRIKQDFAKAGAHSSLPDLTFTDSGKLERSHSKEKYSESETTYGNNGHKVVEDFHRLDGKYDTRDIYGANGRVQSHEVNQSGSSQTDTYDRSGKLRSTEARDAAGDLSSNKFDSHGNLTETTMVNGRDHFSGTMVYDPKTGRPMHSDSTDKYGNKRHYEFDARTGKPSSYVSSTPDGATLVASFDAAGNVLDSHQVKQ